jgi:hypothetical protein
VGEWISSRSLRILPYCKERAFVILLTNRIEVFTYAPSFSSKNDLRKWVREHNGFGHKCIDCSGCRKRATHVTVNVKKKKQLLNQEVYFLDVGFLPLAPSATPPEHDPDRALSSVGGFEDEDFA